MGELLTVQGESLPVRGGHGERVRDGSKVHGPGGGGAVGGGGVHQYTDAEQCYRGREEHEREGRDGELAEHDDISQRSGLSSCDNRNRRQVE